MLEAPESSIAPVGEAMAECITQALNASLWFVYAAAHTGTTDTAVAFRTVFGTDAALHVVSGYGPAD
ncbi:hypothetical protein BX265_0180 [Streptomyces sp. TLI_235]|nr:hypothetical protein BX265_0180 [Streptomyces sp. TLI_235]